MPWSGSWKHGVYIGTFLAPDGTLFTVTWTPAQALDVLERLADPPLSSDDSFFVGAPANDRGVHQDSWLGFWHGAVWTGKYKAPGGAFEFAGTITKSTALEGDPPDRRG